MTRLPKCPEGVRRHLRCLLAMTCCDDIIPTMPTLADLIAQKLSDAGVDVVFGLPGGENVDLLDALRRRGIEFVLVRNESSAVFMADTHARLTGGIGVALTTLGPGATNAYVGMAHAWLDRSPV